MPRKTLLGIQRVSNRQPGRTWLLRPGACSGTKPKYPFWLMIQIKQKRGMEVETPPPGSFWCGVYTCKDIVLLTHKCMPVYTYRYGEASRGSLPKLLCFYLCVLGATGWRKCIGRLRFQVSFRRRAPKHIRLFCGKWPIKIRHPMRLWHPVVSCRLPKWLGPELFDEWTLFFQDSFPKET